MSLIKGYFDENMELIPKKPVSQQEMEYEILEGRFGSFIASGLQKVLGWQPLHKFAAVFIQTVLYKIGFTKVTIIRMNSR